MERIDTLRRVALLWPFVALASGCGGGGGATADVVGTMPSPSPSPSPGTGSAGSGYFTDVVSVPVGGYATAYKWDGQTVTKLAQVQVTGASIEAGGQTFTVAIHLGRVREATPLTLASVIQSLQPGDQVVCRGGTYLEKYDSNGWNDSQFVLGAAQSGTATQPISITAYPGETVTFRNNAGRPNFYFGRQDAAQRCNFWTISNLTLNADPMNIDGGGVTSGTGSPESGGTNIRVVGCILQIRALGTVAAGQIELQGDSWKIIGNDFQNDYNRIVDNLNHAIYIDCGADNTVILYNRFVDRREGFVMMVHQDGTPMNYVGTVFSSNYVKARKQGDVRGISHSNVDNGSTMLAEDNYFENVGVGGFGPLTIYRGTVTARRNTFVSPAASIEISDLFGGTQTLFVGSGSNANVWQSSLAQYSFDGVSASSLVVE